MMLLKNVSNSMNILVYLSLIGILNISSAQAQPLECESSHSKNNDPICDSSFDDIRDELNERFLTTYLVSDAPTRLIQDTQLAWINRLQQCKTKACRNHQINSRIDDLNFYISMNQSLTQHFLKFENGQITPQLVHLKIHQLSKDRIKIEGTAYRNPNNRIETQTIPLLAYTTTNSKNEILDNEHDCKYQLNFQKALLIVSSSQKNCERFNGIYRLYD